MSAARLITGIAWLMPVWLAACGEAPPNGSDGRTERQLAIENLYNRSCISCHIAGAAGAPRTGDTEAWQKPLAKGMDVLVRGVRNGYNAMPPLGLCHTCTDEDFADLIDYMATSKP